MRVLLIVLISIAFSSYSQCDLGVNSRKLQGMLWEKLWASRKSNDVIRSKDIVKQLSKVSCPEDSLYRRALSYRMKVYINENDIDAGISFADSIIPILRSAKKDIYLAEIIYHTGLCYYRKRNWLKSGQIYKELKANSSDYFENDNLLHFSINNMLAQCYRREDLSSALELYQENLRFLGDSASHALISLTYHNIASIYKHKSDYAQEEYYLKAAIIERKKDADYNIEQLAHSYNNLGVNYSGIGKRANAIEAYLNAIRLYESLDINRQNRLWLTYVNISIDYFELGYANKAINYCKKAISKIESENTINQSNLQYTYSILARAYRLSSANDKALKYFKLSVEHEGGMLAGNLARFSNYYHEIGDLKSANRCIDEAIHFMATKSRIDPSDTYAVPKLDQILPKGSALNILKRKPSICLELYKRTGINNYLKTAFDFALFNMKVLNRKKSEAINNSSIVNLLNKHHSVYSQLINIGLQMFTLTKDNYYLDIANRALEHSKHGVLQKLLLTKLEDVYPNVDLGIIREESVIKQKLNSLNSLLEKARYADNNLLIDSIKVELAKVDLDRTSMEKRIYKLYPEYAELKYRITSPSIREKQTLLENNTKLIEYHLDKSTSTLISFVFTNNSCDFIVKDIDDTFFSDVNKFIGMIKHLDHDAKKYQNLSHQLYTVLLEDAIDSTDLDIIISPSDILYSVPFDALVRSKVSTPQYNKLNYLAFSHNISVSPIFKVSQNRIRTHNVYSGFAPVNFDNYAALPNSINELFDRGNNYTYLEASESTVKAVIDATDILHLASHGIINDTMPLQSHLVLNPDDNNDGLLHTYEVFGMHASSKLVILSACNTGVGKMYDGEGVMSMTKAFQFAGAQSIVMSLWATDDGSSTEIIKGFIKYYMDGEPLDAALCESKREYIRNAHPLKTHPFYWSGLQLNGDRSAIYAKYNKGESPSGTKWTDIALGLLALLGISYAFFYKKSRSRN